MNEPFLLPADMDFTVTPRANNATLDIAFTGSTHRHLPAQPVLPPRYMAIHMPSPKLILIKFRDGRWASRCTLIKLLDGRLQQVVILKGNHK